jgi:putative peptide zinc metalloprotease protein
VTDPQQAQPTLAERLRETRVGLRADIDVSRHVFRGRVSYVLRDPITFASHRFGLSDYRVLQELSPSRSLGEVFETVVCQGLLDPDDEQRFYHFVLFLHKLSFLKLPISDGAALYERHRAKEDAKRKQRFKSILFYRIPILNPDAMLARTLTFARPFFGRPAIVLWCGLVALAAYLCATHWTEFREPAANVFTGANLPWLWLTLTVLKLAHEFGHAYACRSLGGHVPEMGLMLIMFTPCAYVDASASWGFPNRRHRLFVSLAGMYVELGIAAVAMILWSVTPPGFARTLLQNVVILASVVTIGFNANPLMRYDGYYVLSDAIEVPNLRARASRYAILAMRKLFLGIPYDGPEQGGRLRALLLGYGIGAALYKIVLVLGISMLIATKLLAVGIALGGFYIVNELVGALRRLLPYLWRSEEAAPVRGRAIALGLSLTVGLPLALVAVPIPARVIAPGVIGGEHETVLRVQTPGVLRELPFEVGAQVPAGTALALLDEPQAAVELAIVEAQLEFARVQLRATSPDDPATCAQALETVNQLDDQRRFLMEQSARLTLRSPHAGALVYRQGDESIGAYVPLGTHLGTVAGGRPMVRALLTSEDLAGARPVLGQRVEFRCAAQGGTPLYGHIERIDALGSRALAPAFLDHLDLDDFALHPLTMEAGREHYEVDVLLEDSAQCELPWGATGSLRLAGEPESIAVILFRKARTFLDRLRS